MKKSISQIKLFKACRRAYELKYIENLIPVEKADALQVGTNYHKLIASLYETGDIVSNEPYSKETAMATAYKKYIYPLFKVRACEEWINKGEFVGIVDGIAADGCLVEHKTTSSDTYEYEADLERDEQILMYMWLTGARSMWYTVCRKPTIRQRRDETDEQFFERMVSWYDTDTDSKIRAFTVFRTDEDIAEFEKSLKGIAWEMDTARHEQMYRNTCYCKAWGRVCEYAPVCLHYDPNQEYIGFTKEKRGYEEARAEGES